MKTRTRILAAVAAAILAASTMAFTARPSAPAAAGMRCAAHRTDHGTSLVAMSRATRIPVPVLLWLDLRCAGGGWTDAMARYLEHADLRAPYRGWYWIVPLA